jgi:ABC-type branched-subunit amino acid transport system substrate-binding protein
LTRDADIPFVGAATLLTQASAQNNRNLFYVLPGATQQARALVNFAAAKSELKKSPLAIVHAETELATAAAAAIEDEARKLGWTSIIRKVVSTESPTAIVGALKAEGVQTVFFLGASSETNFVNAASTANWAPHVFLLGALTASDFVKTVPPCFNDRVFLAFPTVPSDVGPEGLAELRALEEKYKLPAGHTASKLNAFAAAKIFVEALKRAGRDLSREKLITSLEGLYEYDTGVTPNITFGPNRRVGSMGSYVVSADLAKREFVLISNK